MRTGLNNNKLKFHIGDVRNYDSISDAIRGVFYVFHAAALEQVPSYEFSQWSQLELMFWVRKV